MSNITLFSQIIKKIDRSIFKKLVREKQTDKGNKGFDSWTQLVSMLFCLFCLYFVTISCYSHMPSIQFMVLAFLTFIQLDLSYFKQFFFSFQRIHNFFRFGEQ